MGFIVETAAYYFYNRIVEHDGTFALDNGSQANTGHRIKYLKVDADTGEEVASDEIMIRALVRPPSFSKTYRQFRGWRFSPWHRLGTAQKLSRLSSSR
jgi:hypothetical protein